MRIALVLFLLIVVSLPFFAQIDQAQTWLEEGRTLVQKRQYSDALKPLGKAANIYRKEGKKIQRVKVLVEITETLLADDENYEAQKIAQRILSLTARKDTLAASAFHLLGIISSNNGFAKEALNYFEKGLKIRSEKLPPQHQDIATSLQAIGLTQNKLGQTDLAFENIQKALDINKKIFGTEHPATAATYGALGTIHSTKGKHDRAIQLIQQAIDILKNQKEKDEEALVQQYFYIGNAHLAKRNYDLGLMNAQRGLTILESIKGTEHPTVVSFLNTIGKTHTERGDYLEALRFYKRALELGEFHFGNEHPDIATSYTNIAEVLRSQGQLDSALLYFQKSLTLNEKLFGESHPRTAQSWSDMGSTFFELKKLDQALAYFNNAYSHFRDVHGTRHMNIAKVEQQIGKTYLQKGGLEVALEHFQYSLNANVPLPYEALKISETPPLDKVLDKNIFLGTLALKAQTLTKLFLTKEKFENIELAFENILLCDSLIDDIRRSFIEYNDQLIFNQIASQVYEEAIYTCLILNNHTKDKKYIEQAFYFSEKSKSNALLQSFAHDEALHFSDLPDSLEANEIVLKINVAFYQKQLMNALQSKDSLKTATAQQRLLEAKKAYNQFVINLENDFPHYYQLKYDKSVATLADIQSHLENGTTLLEFMSGEKRIFIFSITADEAYIDLVNKPEDFDNFIFSFRKSISDINYIAHSDSMQNAWTTYTSRAYEIYQTLLESPLSSFPKRSAQKLVIVPDGKLGYIPFEILLQEKPESETINYTTLKYVLHNFSISYAFSSTMLLEQKSEPLPNRPLRYGGFAPIYRSGKLSFASTSKDYQYFNKGKFIDLPASRQGVEYIANLLNGTPFVEEMATEKIFKDTSHYFDILHLAMHGVYDDKEPLNSHLVFTQTEEQKEDNFLTAAELYNKDVDARLVFLGACNSGFGKINRGEGIMSLSRAFAYAGCPSIIMSLWSVPDDETASITNAFFRRLKNGASKDEALRQAKIEYLQDSNIPPDRLHPLYWAGFVPIGEMTPLYTSSPLSNNWTLLAAFGMLALAIFVGMRLWQRINT